MTKVAERGIRPRTIIALILIGLFMTWYTPWDWFMTQDQGDTKPHNGHDVIGQDGNGIRVTVRWRRGAHVLLGGDIDGEQLWLPQPYWSDAGLKVTDRHPASHAHVHVWTRQETDVRAYCKIERIDVLGQVIGPPLDEQGGTSHDDDVTCDA